MSYPFECPVCGHKKSMPQTKADRFRAMSDEELAKACSENCKGMETCAICPLDGKSCAESEVVSDWLEWLKQPAEEP